MPTWNVLQKCYDTKCSTKSHTIQHLIWIFLFSKKIKEKRLNARKIHNYFNFSSFNLSIRGWRVVVTDVCIYIFLVVLKIQLCMWRRRRQQKTPTDLNSSNTNIRTIKHTNIFTLNFIFFIIFCSDFNLLFFFLILCFSFFFIFVNINLHY